jgi:hypothetical protein
VPPEPQRPGPPPRAATRTPTSPAAHDEDDELESGFRSLRRGDFDGAMAAWTRFLRARPNDVWSERVKSGVDAVASLRSLLEARNGE